MKVVKVGMPCRHGAKLCRIVLQSLQEIARRFSALYYRLIINDLCNHVKTWPDSLASKLCRISFHFRLSLQNAKSVDGGLTV
jgi:hypothetical protein